MIPPQNKLLDSLMSHATLVEHVMPEIKPLEIQSPAEWLYERLTKQIVEFEAALDANEEIGARLVSAPGIGAFHIEDMGYWGPDMIIFHGKNEHGKPVQLLQHHTQLNLLLTALPKEKDVPRRIGFMLEAKLSEKDEG